MGQCKYCGEDAGFFTAGAPLIGASVIAGYATASLGAGCNATGREGYSPRICICPTCSLMKLGLSLYVLTVL